ncbi:MAG: Gfo/Idh/MocA family oxidoreductase [Planctomycetales bacterium]
MTNKPSRQNISRRRFLKQSAWLAAGTTFAIGGTKSTGRILGANEKVRIAVAGIHGRGKSHVGSYNKNPDAQIVYLVDPDTRTYKSQSDAVEDATGVAPKCVQDIRRALDDKNVDAVSIATPNHWHALMTVWACNAGKDVYVEKPCSHNLHEGRVALEAARKNNRIVQHGTQNRSSARLANVMQVIKSGQLGKLLVSRGLCYKQRESIGFKERQAPPPEVDFNLWLGPAAEQAYHGNLVHYNWHWFWETGNGDIGNQGVHQMDIARWAIPNATLPTSVLSLGGRFGYEDQGQTANTQISIMDFGDTKLIFEVRGRPTDNFHGQGVGNIFHLEAGTIYLDKYFPKDSDKEAPLPRFDTLQGAHNGDHFGNFVSAVRSRKREELHADIMEGHYSSALCHLANISYRLGKPVAFSEVSGQLGTDGDLRETFSRMEHHLKDDVHLDLANTKVQLGRKLTLDPTAEKFAGDADANAMLTRNYRKGFDINATA